MPFAISLKKLRELIGLTQEELALKSGLTKSTISMYECGKRFPDEPTLNILADILNVDMDTLLGKKDKSTYYLNPETAYLAQKLHDNPQFKIMFDASKDLSPQSVQEIIEFIKYQRHKEGRE